MSWESYIERNIDGVEKIKLIIEIFDLKNSTRSEGYIHKRAYLYNLLRVNELLTYEEIGKMFNKNHATIMHGIGIHKKLTEINCKVYAQNTREMKYILHHNDFSWRTMFVKLTKEVMSLSNTTDIKILQEQLNKNELNF